MDIKMSLITDYVSNVLKLYNEYKQHNAQCDKTLYRLVDIKKDSKNNDKIYIQLIGKSVVFTATPEEILDNDKIIEHFSSKDIYTITKLVNKKTGCQPKKKITGKRFSFSKKQLVFTLKSLITGKVNEATATQISNNQTELAQLSAQDAHTIGYAAALELDTLASPNKNNQKT